MRYMGSGIGHKHSVQYRPEVLPMDPTDPSLDEEITNILGLPGPPESEVTIPEEPFTIEDDMEDELVGEEPPDSEMEDDDDELELSDIDDDEGYISH